MGVSPRLALLALFLLVVPAGITALVLTRSSSASVRAGRQPGGRVQVVVRPPAGAHASLSGLAIELVAVGSDGARRALASARCDEAGRAQLEAPAHEGHYEVVPRDPDWQPAARPFSLIDAGEPFEIELPLRPAARLVLAFTRRDGRAVRGGDWSVRGDPGGSWFSAWSRPRLERGGSFDGAELTVTGLPPMRAEIVVRVDGSERIELVIDLTAGENRHTIEL